jgi:hypothetical protein
VSLERRLRGEEVEQPVCRLVRDPFSRFPPRPEGREARRQAAAVGAEKGEGTGRESGDVHDRHLRSQPRPPQTSFELSSLPQPNMFREAAARRNPRNALEVEGLIQGNGGLGAGGDGDGRLDLSPALWIEAPAPDGEVAVKPEAPQQRRRHLVEMVERRAPGDVGAAGDHQGRCAVNPGECRKECLEDEGGGAGGADVDPIGPGADRAGREGELPRPKLGALGAGGGDLRARPYRGEVLMSKPRLAPVRPYIREPEGPAGYHGKGESGANDLAAALTVTTIDKDGRARAHDVAAPGGAVRRWRRPGKDARSSMAHLKGSVTSPTVPLGRFMSTSSSFMLLHAVPW